MSIIETTAGIGLAKINEQQYELQQKFPGAVRPVHIPQSQDVIYPQPITSIEIWSPEDADFSLTYCAKENNRNRTNLVSESRVQQYKTDMDEEEWGDLVVMLVFDKYGMMLNGHHTLMAQKRSNTFQMYVVLRGQETENYKHIDIHKTRGNPELLKGLSTRRPLACAIGRRISIYTNILDKSHFGGALKGNSYSTSTISLNFTENHLEKINQAVNVVNTTRCTRIQLIPSVAGTCYYLFHQIDAEQCDIFFESAFSGLNLTEGSPIVALRQRLLNQTRQKKLDEQNQFALMFKAWNMFIAGRKIPANKFYWSAEQHKFPVLVSHQ